MFVFPSLRVNKIAIRHDFQISALSMHRCVAQKSENFDGPSSTLTFEGDFSGAIIGSWLKSGIF